MACSMLCKDSFWEWWCRSASLQQGVFPNHIYNYDVRLVLGNCWRFPSPFFPLAPSGKVWLLSLCLFLSESFLHLLLLFLFVFFLSLFFSFLFSILFCFCFYLFKSFSYILAYIFIISMFSTFKASGLIPCAYYSFRLCKILAIWKRWRIIL